MNRQIIHDGRNSYLRLPAKAEAGMSYKMKVLNYNQPEQLLGVRFINNGTESCFEYLISGLVPLTEAGAPELLFQYLHAILFSLERLSNILGEYYLSAEEVCLDPENVYLQTETGRILFCYRPEDPQPVQRSLQKLMEFFMKEMNPSRESEVLLLYGLFQKSREANITFGTLAQYWRSLEKQLEAEQKVQQKPIMQRNTGAAELNPDESEDDLLYRDLGLKIPDHRTALYDEWAEKSIEAGKNGWTEKNIETGKDEGAERSGKPVRNVYSQEISAGRPTEPVMTEKERKNIQKRAERKTKDRIGRSFSDTMREHSFELGIGAIVAAGVILFLFT